MSPFRILSPWMFSFMNLSKYDVVIVSATGVYFPNLVKRGKAVQVCFCHTPPRYLYGYTTARDWKTNPITRILGELANHFLRMIDYKAAQRVDYFIANSEEVKKRIEKFYRKDSVVMYPPVATVSHENVKKEDYYLTGGRLARAKGIDIILEAFEDTHKKLMVFGRGFAGFEEELLEGRRGKNIEFLGEVTDREKYELMSKAKAFVFASFDEDFGITPVEAMSVGTPVIAYNSGGVKETVIDGKTGVFFNEHTKEAIREAIERFEKMRFSPEECRKQAAKFSKERFEKEIKEFINARATRS